MRVAIVNDLQLAREVLRKLVLTVPGYSIAWLAEDGEKAVRQAKIDRPDCILMDLQMPVLNGADATKQIMQVAPCPILIVTSSLTINLELAYRALGAGGLDAVETPSFGPNGTILNGESILKRLARVAQTTQKLDIRNSTSAAVMTSTTTPLAPMLVLGASTGGPHALATILSMLPKRLHVPILLVQHIAADFTSSLAQWLARESGQAVELAKRGDRLLPGKVFLAGEEEHLVLRADQTLDYQAEPRDYPYRPSVDALFLSLSRFQATKSVAVLLTGMGADGAEGLLQLKQSGWWTIAQDQASSVVYGMPRAAMEKNAARQILPLTDIAGSILMNLGK